MQFNLIIVDMDGTITKNHTFKEGLKKCYEFKGEKIYEDIILNSKNTVKRRLSPDNMRMKTGLTALIHGGFRRKFENELIDSAFKNLNSNLVGLLDKVNKKKEVIIISRSSETIAKNIAYRLGFSAGYGSIMEYAKNGALIGALRLVSDKSDDAEFLLAKETLAKYHMEKKGKTFSLEKTAYIGNDILDLDLMSKVGLTILVKNEKIEFADKIAHFFKLYDLDLKKDYNEIKRLILDK